MPDEILGNCNCPDGPPVRSKLHPDAIYLHVRTAQGIRCCRKTPEGEIRYGTILEPSPSEIASREASTQMAVEASAKKLVKRKRIQALKEKRKKGETLSSEDISVLADVFLN